MKRPDELTDRALVGEPYPPLDDDYAEWLEEVEAAWIKERELLEPAPRPEPNEYR